MKKIFEIEWDEDLHAKKGIGHILREVLKCCNGTVTELSPCDPYGRPKLVENPDGLDYLRPHIAEEDKPELKEICTNGPECTCSHCMNYPEPKSVEEEPPDNCCKECGNKDCICDAISKEERPGQAKPRDKG